MTELSKPSSADILWHLPDFLYCLVDQENLKDLHNGRSDDPSYLVCIVSPTLCIFLMSVLTIKGMAYMLASTFTIAILKISML